MISFQHVAKRYSGSHDAVADLDFEITAGEMVFLTGHSGAGKSTLLKLLTLEERASRGEILVDQLNLTRLHPRDVPYYRRRLGMVLQDHRLLTDRNVYENVALPLRISGYSEYEIGRRVRAALDKVGLLSKEHLFPLGLSGGEQQRIGIARAVVNKPQLLLADEPTGNLDPALSFEIMRVFSQFSEVGVTVLVATHDIGLISTLNIRRLELSDGRLVSDTAAESTNVRS